MSELASIPALQESQKRQKTPEEVNAQVARIAEKLMKRSKKIMVSDSSGGLEVGGTTVGHVDRGPGRQEIITTRSISPDKGSSTEWVNSRSSSIAPDIRSTGIQRGFGEVINPDNTLIHTVENLDDKGLVTGSKMVTVSFSDAGSKATLTEHNYGERPKIQDLPPENDSSNAAGILMKLRGDIAAQEIAGNQTPQVKTAELLK